MFRWYNFLTSEKRETCFLQIDPYRVHSSDERKDPDIKFKETVMSIEFWTNVTRIRSALEMPTNLLGKLESNSSDLSVVYSSFKKLSETFSVEETYRELVLERWNFLHTESMGFAYLLSPKTRGGEDMIQDDRKDTINQLKKYINVFFQDAEKRNAGVRELTTFLASFSYSNNLAVEDIEDHLFWSVYGRIEYPVLAEIAIRVYQVPTSSAESERAWSVFNLIHSERRNRLSNVRVNKLAFVYINRAFRGIPENYSFHFEDQNA